jgi:hypothetical protein
MIGYFALIMKINIASMVKIFLLKPGGIIQRFLVREPRKFGITNEAHQFLSAGRAIFLIERKCKIGPSMWAFFSIFSTHIPSKKLKSLL